MKINNDLLLNFGKIVVNKNLPKYTELPKPEPKKSDDTVKMSTSGSSFPGEEMMDTPLSAEFFSSGMDPEIVEVKLSDFVSKADAKAFNVMISGQLLSDINKYRPSYSIAVNNTGTITATPIPADGSNPEIKEDEKYIHPC